MSNEKEIIETNTMNYITLSAASPVQYEIQRHLRKLDDVTTRFECCWGVGRLPNLVGGELAQKWDRHWGKIEEAVLNSDLYSMPELVDGAIRGFDMLEDVALKAGHKPLDPTCWEIEVEGEKFAVYQTRADEMGAATEQGIRKLCLEELVRVYKTRHEQVLEIVAPEIKALPKAFFDKGGDPIPF